MRFEEALADLDGRRETRMIPDLTRITAVSSLLSDPQLTYPTIHVTGTNGKTTTARTATAIACAHGITTGLFTSPHLLRVTERLAVCGAEMTPHEFGEEYEHLLPFLRLVDAKGEERVTYFEALAALASLWFADKPVGLAVFEVGMGGTWDATNLVAGDVAVLCPIGLDHPELGSTIAEVATEKAGIIKPGKSVVSREQPQEALDIIEARCADYEASLMLEFRDWELDHRLTAVGGQSFEVRGVHAAYDELFLPLFGEYAARNAAAAIVAVESLLGHALDVDATREALLAVRSPGRLEVVSRQPTVLLDGAHNPAGAEALAVAMREFFRWDRLHLVIAVSANKDVAGIVAPLAPLADIAYVATHESERAGDPIALAQLFGAADTPVRVYETVSQALDAARAAAAATDLILVTGSLYTVADARRALGEP
jgi:dihydrofolate synthase / folylpolyglutamate synthase